MSDIPGNIEIFECKDDGSFGPMLAGYFEKGNGSIFATRIKDTWYFYNAAKDAENDWHKPGPMGAMFCEKALSENKLQRISEEYFEEQTGIWYLDSTRSLMGSPDPWTALED